MPHASNCRRPQRATGMKKSVNWLYSRILAHWVVLWHRGHVLVCPAPRCCCLRPNPKRKNTSPSCQKEDVATVSTITGPEPEAPPVEKFHATTASGDQQHGPRRLRLGLAEYQQRGPDTDGQDCDRDRRRRRDGTGHRQDHGSRPPCGAHRRQRGSAGLRRGRSRVERDPRSVRRRRHHRPRIRGRPLRDLRRLRAPYARWCTPPG